MTSITRFLNKRAITKAIHASRPTRSDMRGQTRDGYVVHHDIPGEAIVCEVPTLEIAGCIVNALRQRQEMKLAIALLARHRARQLARAGSTLRRRNKK